MIKLKDGRDVVGDIISSIGSHIGRCRKVKQGKGLMQMILLDTEIFLLSVSWSHALFDGIEGISSQHCFLCSTDTTFLTRSYWPMDRLLMNNKTMLDGYIHSFCHKPVLVAY